MILASLTAFVAGSTAYWQYRSTFAIPFADQWPAVLDYFRFRSGEIGIRSLFAQSNEHRIFFPRLIMFADLKWFGGQNAFNVVMSDVFQVIHLLVLLWMGRPLLVRPLAGWTVAAFIVTAMLNGSQYENIYWGFQSQFVMVFLFGSLSLALMTGLASASVITATTRPSDGATISAVVLATAILSALVSTFSMINGLLIWPLLVLAALQRRAGWPVIAVIVAVGAGATAFYLHDYTSIGSHTPVTAALHRPLDALPYFFAYLGSLVTPQDPRAALGIGIAFAALVALLAARAIGRPGGMDRRRLFLWCVVLFVLASAAATTLGRFGFGIVQAVSPRYITPDAVLWSAVALLTLEEIQATCGSRTWNVTAMVAALLTGWLALVDQPLSFARMADHQRKMAVASDAVLTGVTDAATLADLASDPGAIGLLSALLKPLHLSVFAGREADWMGEAVDKAFTVVRDPSCLGDVDVVRPLGEDGADGFAIAGWAWVGSEEQGPAEVVFADADGTIVGFARGQLSRADVAAKRVAVHSERVGWRGFLRPASDPDVRAFALMDDARKACPLGP